jgi:hypothetical protein
MLWKGEDSRGRGGGCFVFMYDVVRCAVQCRGRSHSVVREGRMSLPGVSESGVAMI